MKLGSGLDIVTQFSGTHFQLHFVVRNDARVKAKDMEFNPRCEDDIVHTCID